MDEEILNAIFFNYHNKNFQVLVNQICVLEPTAFENFEFFRILEIILKNKK